MIDLSKREMSSFPVSIGTGLMLESLFEPITKRIDEERKIPNKINVNEYTYHYYNILTLARNIANSAKVYDITTIVNTKEFLNTIIEETAVLNELYDSSNCSPILFLPEYDNVYINFNKDKNIPSVAGNPNKRWWIEYTSIKSLYKKLIKNSHIDILHNDYRIPPYNGKTLSKHLITTSYPCDLLNHSSINNISLIESHTGVLKTELSWNTKYHKIGTKDLQIFPFNERLLYILGDTHNMIAPEKINIRNELYALAVSCNWTPRTTDEKVVSDIKKSPLLYNIIKNYKKIY